MRRRPPIWLPSVGALVLLVAVMCGVVAVDGDEPRRAPDRSTGFFPPGLGPGLGATEPSERGEPGTIVMPDVIGRPLEDARWAVLQLGLSAGGVQVRVIPGEHGTVLATTPPPGTRMARGEVVSFLISTPTPPPSESVPDLRGSTGQLGKVRLESLGFRVRIITAEWAPPGAQRGFIVEQEPPSGMKVVPKALITLFVVGKGTVVATAPPTR